jgi:hypothetical protein
LQNTLGRNGMDPDVEHRNVSFSLSFTDWSEWLGMELSDTSIANFSGPELIIHCLWEMTFTAYDRDIIAARRDELIQTARDAKEAHKDGDADAFSEL